MKTYCVGDVHGRADLLYKAILMAVAHSNGERARFVCTGDMIDRGPDSAQVIDIMRRCRLENLSLIALQGNHESMMIEAIRSDRFRIWEWWTGHGGWETLDSYELRAPVINDNDVWRVFPQPSARLLDDIAWLEGLPSFLWDDPHRVYVHGGMMYDVEREFQDKNICQWVFLKNRLEDTPPFEGRHVVHGHAQYKNGPILTTNRTNLDTYAWKHGRLAIGVFDDDIPGGPIEILWATDPGKSPPKGN